MTAAELLIPRFEIIAGYPNSIYAIGDLVEEHVPDKFHYISDGNHQYASSQTLEKYPHLFRKLNWWEHRKEEDMPKKLISMSSKDDPNFDIEKEEVYEILKWDMVSQIGFVNIEKRLVCDLCVFNPEYGYFPVD